MAPENTTLMEDRVKAFSDNAAFYKQSTDFTAKFAKHAFTLVPPMDASSVVHDNASGPGVVAFAIASQFPDVKDCPTIFTTDAAQGMVDMINGQIKAMDKQDKISAQLVDARDLSVFEDNKFTHSFTHFAIMMEDDAALSVAKEIYRTLKPGGTASVITWQRAGSELMENVCRRIKPDVEPLKVIPAGWEKKEKLIDTLITGGFKVDDINVHLKEDEWDFGSEEKRLEYLNHPFWGLWRKGWTDEEIAQWPAVMKEEVVKFTGERQKTKGIAWIGIARKA